MQETRRDLLSSIRATSEDCLKRLLFEFGAGYYAQKLASGPEAELREDFAEFLLGAMSATADAPSRVLDVGCGPGHLARLLARRNCQVTAVDRGIRILRLAKRWAEREGVRVNFQHAAAGSLPFPDHSFDACCATTVIYFLEDPVRALCEIVRVTRPGGIVATLDPSASMSISAIREYGLRRRLSARDRRKLNAWALAARFNRRFSEAELTALFQSAGLADCRLEPRLDGLVWFARGTVPTVR